MLLKIGYGRILRIMKTRYVFGYRDVVVTIVGAVFLFGVIYAQDYLASNGFYFFKRYCYLPDVFLAIVSGVFGYVPGVVAGISGRVLAGMLLLGNVEYIDVISVALFAFIIGINSGRYRVLEFS